ncbi:hypothetical protein SAMN04515659_3562 [Dyella sp. 333MFSha]|nr:hypothetical protein SAMN04515659_3562 [Dyella sp. 333MFSha]
MLLTANVLAPEHIARRARSYGVLSQNRFGPAMWHLLSSVFADAAPA